MKFYEVFMTVKKILSLQAPPDGLIINNYGTINNYGPIRGWVTKNMIFLLIGVIVILLLIVIYGPCNIDLKQLFILMEMFIK